MDPVENILGKNHVKCFNCGEEIVGKRHYWYHGDQDDLVCSKCAKKLKHTDTAYAGTSVYREH